MKLHSTTNDARRVRTTFIRISLALFLTTAISTAQTFGVAHIDSGEVVNQTAGFDLNVSNPLAGVFELGIGGIPGTPLLQADGVLIANIVHGNSGIATMGGELTGDSASGSYALFTTSFVGNDQNRDTSLAYFPFADGWQGGHFASDGSTLAASLPVGSTMTPLGVAIGGARLYSLVIDGVDSRTDGMLFVVAQSHSTPSKTNVINAAPMADGTWTITMREEATPITPNDAFSVVYVPYDTPSLVGGLIDDTGSVLESRGSFAVTHEATGTYRITIPGVTTAADGVLLVSTAQEGTNGGHPLRRGIVYDFNASLGAFEVKTRQTGNSPPYEDTGLVFTFLRFDTPLFPAADYVGTDEDLITEIRINSAPLSTTTLATLTSGDAITPVPLLAGRHLCPGWASVGHRLCAADRRHVRDPVPRPPRERRQRLLDLRRYGQRLPDSYAGAGGLLRLHLWRRSGGCELFDSVHRLRRRVGQWDLRFDGRARDQIPVSTIAADCSCTSRTELGEPSAKDMNSIPGNGERLITKQAASIEDRREVGLSSKEAHRAWLGGLLSLRRACAEPSDDNPEHAIAVLDPGALDVPHQHHELLAEEKVLDCEPGAVSRDEVEKRCKLLDDFQHPEIIAIPIR